MQQQTTNLPRLPRGPHQLSREAVEQSQRNRILLAVMDVVAERGWGGTSVSAIVARAGVSRSTFYELYSDRLDCFLAANEIASNILLSVMRERLTSAEHEQQLDFVKRTTVLMNSYLETLRANPGLARVFLVEVYAAGPQAIAQRRRAMDEFVELFVAAQAADSENSATTLEEERMMTAIIVAAMSSFVTNAVGADDIESLDGLQEQVTTVIERLAAFRG